MPKSQEPKRALSRSVPRWRCAAMKLSWTMAEEFLGVGEERELVTGEQSAPGGGVTGAGGGDVGVEIRRGVGCGAVHRAPEADRRYEWNGRTRERFNEGADFSGRFGPGRKYGGCAGISDE